ncbi:MAG: site-specific tyrosine recombinase XerD [Bacteroidetes bacterium]|nr:site-specific tyrosine recombinase XerD [Bacteroidota bacterium]
MSDWSSYIKGFKAYLQLEKSLSGNSVDAYVHDVNKFVQYLDVAGLKLSPEKVELHHLQEFLKWITLLGMTARSQARIISGLKGFYKYLLLENVVLKDPTEMLESPKIGRKLPRVLTVEEIDKLIGGIDLSKSEGERNKAMLETLYGCGLRVSELVDLKVSNLYFNDGFIKVIGKGNKERLVPLGSIAAKHIMIYMKSVRSKIIVKKGYEDILFLNRRGSKLSRVMVFLIIKTLALKTGTVKNISPHTFRHSFATHLVEGGADLRAVQEMLGHESITTTEIYTHLDKEYLRSTILQYHPRS